MLKGDTDFDKATVTIPYNTLGSLVDENKQLSLDLEKYKKLFCRYESWLENNRKESNNEVRKVHHEDARQAVGLWAMCLNADEHREAQYNARLLIREYIMQCEEMEKELKNSMPIPKIPTNWILK